MNIEIAKQFKTLDQFSVDPPVLPPKLTVLGTKAAVSLVVNDQRSFKVSHLNKVPDNVSADFMLCGDCSATQVNHTKLDARVKGCPGGLDLFSKCIESTMRKVLTREAYKLKDLYQVDMTKEYGFHCCSRAQADLLVSVARVVMLQTHADFLNLPLATKDNSRKGLSEAEMYKHLETYLNYSLIDNDPAESWRLRRQALESYEKLKTATEELVHSTARSEGFLSHMFSHEVAPAGSLREVGQKFTRDLLGAGYSEPKTATTLYTLASSGVGPIASLVSPLSPSMPQSC